MKNTVYCFDHIIASGILVYSHYKKSRVYISDKSGQGLQERLHPNPNIKIKIVTMMIAREFVVFKPHTNTKGGQKSVHTKQRHAGNFCTLSV